jgi:hypothetical protein
MKASHRLNRRSFVGAVLGGRECRDADASEPDWRNRGPVRRCP